MMKATVKKMILTAAMAAFMAYAPAMAAEEDLIIEESFEAVDETAAAGETAAVEIEVLGLETVAVAEVPEEAAQAAETAETADNAAAETEPAEDTEAVETEAAAAQSFTFENDEVIITAVAAAELPENIAMQVRKLEAGSVEYEAAKAAAAANTGAGEDAQYSFYDVTFTVDGVETELADGSVYAQIEFKTIQIDNTVETQEVLSIDEAGVNNVTAEAEEGSNMSSVSFAM